MRATLSASNTHAGYPGAEVLTDLTFRVRDGDPPLGLIGPSGGGKSTLIDTLMGRTTITQGRVSYNGHDVTKRRGRGAKEFRAEVRAVSQDSLTVTDPRETVASRLKQAAKQARRAGRTHRVSPQDLVASVGLDEGMLPRRVVTLSGGERQRLAMASALATRPKILLLDEPLTALHPQARRDMTLRLGQTIERLGTGVLVASHDLELIARLCAETVFLDQGRLIGRGPLAELLSQPKDEAIADFAAFTPWASSGTGL